MILGRSGRAKRASSVEKAAARLAKAENAASVERAAGRIAAEEQARRAAEKPLIDPAASEALATETGPVETPAAATPAGIPQGAEATPPAPAAEGTNGSAATTNGSAAAENAPPAPPAAAAAPAAAPTRTIRRVEIDFDRMRAAGLVTAHTERTLIAEEFRLIKRPILLKAFDKGPDAIRNGNLVMVASSRPGEGKTFCSVSLAMSIALERDLTVLLIDADVAKPDVPNVLGIETDLGLVDLVADDRLSIPDVLLRTNLDNLSIVPAGRAHHLATELLASDRMERIVTDIAARYPDRVIIFDSPPALMSSVAGVLALHVGQILFVVEADRTSQAALDSALALVNSCNNINLLLNKSRTSGGAERFGTYYNY
jgi:protein-tyrosine kinase